MKRIIIEVRDNPQEVDVSKLIEDVKKKMLDLGLFVKVTVEDE